MQPPKQQEVEPNALASRFGNRAAQRAERHAKLAPDVREAMARDSAYVAGMKAGWNFAVADRDDLFQAAVESYTRECHAAIEAANK